MRTNVCHVATKREREVYSERMRACVTGNNVHGRTRVHASVFAACDRELNLCTSEARETMRELESLASRVRFEGNRQLAYPMYSQDPFSRKRRLVRNIVPRYRLVLFKWCLFSGCFFRDIPYLSRNRYRTVLNYNLSDCTIYSDVICVRR